MLACRCSCRILAIRLQKIADNVFVDEGIAKKVRGLKPGTYGKTAVEEEFRGNRSDDELEQAFLDNIGKSGVDYAAAVHDSVFVFCRRQNNLEHKPHYHGSIKSAQRILSAERPDVLCALGGIATPYIYYGIVGTTFAIHIEHNALSSRNYNMGPGIKLRYVVPPSYYSFLKNAAESVLKIAATPYSTRMYSCIPNSFKNVEYRTRE